MHKPTAILETERRNWFLWLPVALALGALSYFRLEIEPTIISAFIPFAVALVLRKIASKTTVIAVMTGLLVTFTLGMAVAKLRTEWVRAPVLATDTGAVDATGIVELIEPKADKGARITLWLSKLGDFDDALRPARIRVSVRQGYELLSPGDQIRVSVDLLPPPSPAAPGDYDFARHAWFKQLGAVGRAIGPPEIMPHKIADLSFGHRALAELARIRKAIGDRVRKTLPGETGAIANALITGERNAISEETNEAYRASGLYHILSISGLHMAIMGGAVFFALRFVLALIPAIALRFPIKKWAAVGAIAGAGAYLMISGGAFATVRSFIMITVMFAAILLDRPALALRNVAIAAGIIILFFPESVLDPGFQMSFAAVIALIAGYDGLTRAFRNKTDGIKPGSIASMAVLFVAGIIGSTLLASAAVAPFALYHFHQTQHYAVLANLIAIPACNLIVMPAALATLLAMPFGLEAAPLSFMAFGISVMNEAANLVANLPGAVGYHPTINDSAFALIIAGGLIWALVSQPIRWLGAAVALAGLAWTPQRTPPDILIGRSADVVAARGSDGRLSALPGRGLDYTLSRWLERDGDPREAQQAVSQAMHPDAPSNAATHYRRKTKPGNNGPGPATITAQPPNRTSSSAGNWNCDGMGCTITVSGARLAVPNHPAAMTEDCSLADIIVIKASLEAPGTPDNPSVPCNSPMVVVTASDIAAAGAHAITVHRNPVPPTAIIDSPGQPKATANPGFTLHIDTVAAIRGKRPWSNSTNDHPSD